MYRKRIAEEKIIQLASYFPAVAIVGPRQVGKTSLSKRVQDLIGKPSVYLDLESPDDLQRLNNPSLLLDGLADQLVILDEVQLKPDLFPLLRGIIDRDRKPGRFILLGSASPELIRDTSESLAGRIAYHELTPFTFEEAPDEVGYRTLWFRGGFPESLFAPTDELSRIWRQQFIQTYLERDLPLLGLSADPIVIGKLWRMVAHLAGEILNYESLARSLGITSPTVKSYLNFMESAYLIRRLPPFFSNTKKRLIKSPKLYLRDTGILHQLLVIPTLFDLEGNPSLGASWENFVIEQIASIAPDWAELSYYRTHQGTEADLVVLKAGIPWAVIEIKYSTAPRPTRGYYIACDDLAANRKYLVAPISGRFHFSEEIEVLGINDLQAIFE